MEINSNGEKSVVGDNCQDVHDHIRPLTVFGYNPKSGSKHACIVIATVAYTEPETGHAVIFLMNQVLEMKGLDHHLLYPMQCHVNGVLIDEVPKLLAPIPSKTMHVTQFVNPFDAICPIIIPLKVNRVTSCFEVRTPNCEEYKNQNIFKIESTAEAQTWYLSSPECSRQEQSMFNYS